MPLLALFIVIPIVELAVILKVGSYVGVFWTLLLIIVTAFIGVKLLKAQGLSTLMRANQKMQSGQMPAQELAEGFLLALAGALLLTPGFVTDGFGFALLVPAFRKRLIKRVIKFIQPKIVTSAGGFHSDGFQQSPPDSHSEPRRGRDGHITIEGEYTKDD
jgi:UPF0716 protein FxsA